MHTIAIHRVKPPGSPNSLTRVLLGCGIISSMLYVFMNIFVAAQWENYSSVSQTVSELSAIGAPTRTLWVWLGAPYTLLVLLFGWGVLRSAPGNRHLRIAGWLLIIYGTLGIGWPFVPMHLREIIAANGGTLTDTMHIVFGIVTMLVMLLAMGFGAMAFNRRFRFYSILSILLLLVFGMLTAMESPGIANNQPTPWIGLWERINIGVFLVWAIMLAIVLWRNHTLANDQRKVIE